MAAADMDPATRERLTEAARACRILDMEGHGDMTLGHLSVRETAGKGFWMKRNQIGLGEVLGPDDFVLVDWNGKQLAGSGAMPFRMADTFGNLSFARRMSMSWCTRIRSMPASFPPSTEPLQPYTLDADYFIDVPRHEDEVALITTKNEGEAVARSLGDAFAVLMGNHGVTFCGTTIEHAVCAGIFLEKACKAHLAGRAADLKTSMPNRSVRESETNRS